MTGQRRWKNGMVDLYEAIAGLFEELAALEQSNAELKARVEMLEKGGKQK